MKNWCTLLVLIAVSFMANCQTYENLVYALHNRQNDYRNCPGWMADVIDDEINNRFPIDENSNEICLESDWDRGNINTCIYSQTTIGGRSWWQAASEDFRNGGRRNAVRRLQWSNALSQECYDLISLQGPAGSTGHTGEDGSTLRDRANRYLSSYDAVGETLIYADQFGDLSEQIVRRVAIDDGDSELSHRENMYDPTYTHSGSSCGCHAEYGLVCCIAYGTDIVEQNIATPNIGDMITGDCTIDDFGDNSFLYIPADGTQNVNSGRQNGELIDNSIRDGEFSAIYLDSESAGITSDGYGDNSLGGDDVIGGGTIGAQDNEEIDSSTTQEGGGVPTNAAGQTPAEAGRQAANQVDPENAQDVVDSVNANEAEEQNGTPGTYENNAQTILDAINRIRTDPDTYATNNYNSDEDEYLTIYGRAAVGPLSLDGSLQDIALTYTNNIGFCGRDSDGNMLNGDSIVDVFQDYLSDWGFSVFGLLDGSIYNRNTDNVIDAIIAQIGDDNLFNEYYTQFAIGCSWSTDTTFTCAYILSDNVSRRDNRPDMPFYPVLPQDQCASQCDDLTATDDNNNDDD